MITNKKSLPYAVKLALCASLTMTPAIAEDAGEKTAETKAERMTVTGSRIKQTDIESALPVTVISAEEIEKSGLTDVAAVLRLMPFNAQGSFVSKAGSSAANHSHSGLRGLGSTRTLTLINGRRIAPSATYTDGGANLNLIPLTAVERIEILRDGASAIYGSDAIGGVFNIILKDDYDGYEFSLNAQRPSGESGDENGFTLMLGRSFDQGNFLTVIERRDEDGIQYGTRGPLNANWDTGYNRSTLYAPEGNWHTVDENGAKNGPWSAGPNCGGDRNVKSRLIPVSARDAEGKVVSDGERCGFSFLDGKSYIPKREKNSIYTNMNYEFSPEFFFNASFMLMDDSTLTSGTSVWTPDTFDIIMEADNPNNPTFGTDNPQRVRPYTRLVDVADRDVTMDADVFDFNTSLTWANDYGDLVASFQRSQQEVTVTTNNWIYPERLKAAIESGAFNPFVRGGNADQETINSFIHTPRRDTEAKTSGYNLTWSAEAPVEFNGGALTYAFGTEYQKLTTFDRYADPESLDESVVFPTFGGNSGGERSYRAFFAEASLPLMDNLVVNLAARNDAYSLPDKSQLSKSMNVRYELSDSFVVRAAYGEGFRAPSLDDLLSEAALSFNIVTDTTRCNSATPPADFERWCQDGEQIRRNSAGRVNLDPETSEQWSTGMVVNFTDDVSMALDYYSIKMKNQISFLGAQAVVDLEAAGAIGNYDPEVIRIVRDETTGDITDVFTSSINQNGTTTQGIDLDIKSRFSLNEWGDLSLGFLGSYVLEYETQDTPLSDRFDEVGFITTPEHRFNTSLGYVYGDFNALMTYRLISAYRGESPQEVAAGIQKDGLQRWETIDLNMSYLFQDYGQLSFGILNLTDELPRINTALRDGFDPDNHSIEGRVLYTTYKISF